MRFRGQKLVGFVALARSFRLLCAVEPVRDREAMPGRQCIDLLLFRLPAKLRGT